MNLKIVGEISICSSTF